MHSLDLDSRSEGRNIASKPVSMDSSDSSSSCDKMVHMNTGLDGPSISANSSSTSLIGNDKELKSSTRFDQAVEKMNQTGDMLCDIRKSTLNKQI
jgi:hypothetical protein